MERSKYFLLLLILSVFLSCEEETEPQFIPPLYKSWRLDVISVKTQDNVIKEYKRTDEFYEVRSGATESQSNKNERKQFTYLNNGTYQINWLVNGDYDLGTPGESNWQPGIGYYELTDNGDSIIHNRGLPFETAYAISFVGENIFYRTSLRQMTKQSPDGGQTWSAEDIVEFTERFVLVELQ